MDTFTTTAKRVQAERMYKEADREVIAVVAANACEAATRHMERAKSEKPQKETRTGAGVMDTLRSLEVFGAAAGGCLVLAAGMVQQGNLPAAAATAAAGVGIYVIGGR